MPDLKPEQSEGPLEFVNQADAIGIPDDEINTILSDRFGIHDDREIKSLRLKSETFWKKFYLEHAQGILARGGSRYAAVRFIEDKNGKAGQRKLSEEEITEIVESAGPWKR